MLTSDAVCLPEDDVLNAVGAVTAGGGADLRAELLCLVRVDLLFTDGLAVACDVGVDPRAVADAAIRRLRGATSAGARAPPPPPQLRFDAERHGPNVSIADDGAVAVHTGGIGWQTAMAQCGFSAGRHTWRVVAEEVRNLMVGIAPSTHDARQALGSFQQQGHGLYYNGQRYHEGSLIASTGLTFKAGDTVSVTLDCDEHTVSWTVNGVGKAHARAAGIAAVEWVPCVDLGDIGDGTRVSNIGDRARFAGYGEED